jgi:hypothetical protein
MAEASEVAAIIGSAEHADALYELLLPSVELTVLEGRASYCYG